MLAHAERHRLASPHRSRVEFKIADAKRIDFPDAHFDTVFSNTILHHVPDPEPFLKEARRVLKPGGVLLIRDLFRPPDLARAPERVRTYAADASPYQQELFRASLCAALLPEELRAVADRAGLAQAEIVIDTDRHMSLQIAKSRTATGRG
jgi:ubiquinone/menaquinone biosynthesis C-methylase UbiE